MSIKEIEGDGYVTYDIVMNNEESTVKAQMMLMTMVRQMDEIERLTFTVHTKEAV